MEVLFHFLFTIIKIVVLASIYASVLLFLLERIGKSEPKSWLQNISEHKEILRFSLTLLISVLLFAWFFSHWGNHGLGDSARIPLRNGYAITTINANKYAAIDNVVVGRGEKFRNH